MLIGNILKDQKKELKNNNELINIKDEIEKVFEGTQDKMFLVKVRNDNIFEYARNNKATYIIGSRQDITSKKGKTQIKGLM